MFSNCSHDFYNDQDPPKGSLRETVTQSSVYDRITYFPFCQMIGCPGFEVRISQHCVGASGWSDLLSRGTEIPDPSKPNHLGLGKGEISVVIPVPLGGKSNHPDALTQF